MSRSGKPKKIVHPRQRPCPDCGAKPGEPCVLRIGKPLELIHCTIRLTGYPVEGTWKPPKHGPRREPNSSQNEVEKAIPADTTTGVPNKNAGEASQTQPIQPPDGSQDQDTHPNAPAAPGPVGTPPGAAPTEPATSSPFTEVTSVAATGPKKNVFDGGSSLFQSGKPRKKKPRQKKGDENSARDRIEPPLF